MDGAQRANDQEVDPIEFLRAALRISPEDAARVREDAAKFGADPSDSELGIEARKPRGKK